MPCVPVQGRIQLTTTETTGCSKLPTVFFDFVHGTSFACTSCDKTGAFLFVKYACVRLKWRLEEYMWGVGMISVQIVILRIKMKLNYMYLITVSVNLLSMSG